MVQPPILHIPYYPKVRPDCSVLGLAKIHIRLSLKLKSKCIEKMYLFSMLGLVGLGPWALGPPRPKYLQSANEARCIYWAEAAHKPCLTLHVPRIYNGVKGVSQGPRPKAPGPS